MLHTKSLLPCLSLFSAIVDGGQINLSSSSASLSCAQSLHDRNIILEATVNLNSFRLNPDTLLTDQPLTLSLASRSWLVPADAIHGISHSMHCDQSGAFEQFKIQISRLLSSGFDPEAKRFYRMMFPFSGKEWNWLEVQCESYEAEGGYQNYNLVRFSVAGRGEIHLYYFSSKSSPKVLAVDILFPATYIEALDLAYNASLTISLITKTIVMDYCLALAFDDADMTGSFECQFQSLAPTSQGMYEVFSFNMHSLHDFLLRKENASIAYAAKQIEKTSQDGPAVVNSDFIPPIPSPFLNDYFGMLLGNDALQRAAAILIDASRLSLEYEGVMYANALETITTALSVSGPKPVGKATYRKISAQLKAVIKSFADAGEISASGATILSNKINDLNNPPNADKLTVPFQQVGYTLRPYESQAIKDRNHFMHGRLPVAGRTDADFQRLWNICIILHKLCMILLLKNAGYTGLIQNNAIYYKIPEAIAAKEPYFQQI